VAGVPSHAPSVQQSRLADSAEDQLPPFPANTWHRAATAVNYLQTQQKEIVRCPVPTPSES
jgi:hypothetical protein